MDKKDLTYHVKHSYYQSEVVVRNKEQDVAFMYFKIKGSKCNLALIRVEPDYRRKGISTILLQILENECLKEDATIIEGRFFPENKNARFMYEKHGYTIYQDGYEQYLIKSNLSSYDMTNLNIEIRDSRVNNDSLGV
ncbi:MAG: GNAT family N-acetyltransferase [Clostridia bacterium]|nr:GNAT family N-acetyltransferase [Clostridia bacterium]